MRFARFLSTLKYPSVTVHDLEKIASSSLNRHPLILTDRPPRNSYLKKTKLGLLDTIRYELQKAAISAAAMASIDYYFDTQLYMKKEFLPGVRIALKAAGDSLSLWDGSENHPKYSELSDIFEPYILEDLSEAHKDLAEQGALLDLSIEVNSCKFIDDAVAFNRGSNRQIDSTVIIGSDWKLYSESMVRTTRFIYGSTILREFHLEKPLDEPVTSIFESGKVIVGIDVSPIAEITVNLVSANDHSIFIPITSTTRELNVRFDAILQSKKIPEWKIADLDRHFLSIHYEKTKNLL